LGTYIEVSVARNENEFSQCEAAFAKISEIHNLMSFHQSNSDISTLNQSNGEWCELHRDTIKVIRLAKACARASNGLFNPLIGGALVSKEVLPNHNFKDFIEVGDWQNIEINQNQVRIKDKSLICLDGIAKGYAVDCAIAILQKLKCEYAWVNAGGDIRVYGEIIIPIEIRKLNGENTKIGGLKNKAIATSNIFDKPNDDFHSWIIGKSDLGEKTYSVISNSAWRADALTKVAACALPNQRNNIVTIMGGFLIEG
jgi:FAD:protein FMN transferase